MTKNAQKKELDPRTPINDLADDHPRGNEANSIKRSILPEPIVNHWKKFELPLKDGAPIDEDR